MHSQDGRREGRRGRLTLEEYRPSRIPHDSVQSPTRWAKVPMNEIPSFFDLGDGFISSKPPDRDGADQRTASSPSRCQSRPAPNCCHNCLQLRAGELGSRWWRIRIARWGCWWSSSRCSRTCTGCVWPRWRGCRSRIHRTRIMHLLPDPIAVVALNLDILHGHRAIVQPDLTHPSPPCYS